MADYKRIVSYLYQYNHQVKGNNIGFTRLETRNGQCKIIVHVRVPNLQNMIAKVYTYCWYDGSIHGIELGDMNISGGVGEFRLLTHADNLCDTQYRLADMGGILVYISDTVFLGTEWDDRPIQFDVMEVDTERPSDFSQRKNLKGEYFSENNKEVAIAKEETSENQSSIETFQEQRQDFDEVEDIQAADVSLVKEEEILEEEDLDDEEQEEDNHPLSKSRMERLDQKAQELFGNMLNNNIFELKEEDKDVQEGKVVVDPKAAIEFFTDFKSCESKEEYLEVQQEIKRLHSRIEHLELVLKEWRIKESRIKEQKQARLEAEQEKRQIEEELRKSFHIKTAEDIYSDDNQNFVELRVADSKLQSAPEEHENSQEIDDSWDLRDNESSEEPIIHPVVQRILTKYPAIEPFLDIDAGNCVRIEPQDIGIFPMENWILANNSFLLHGYYSYRHLIFFCKKVYNRQLYLLGIPGVNHSRERFMANMFGFSMFLPLTKVQGENTQATSNSMTGNPTFNEEQGGEFGYWCMEIVF